MPKHQKGALWATTDDGSDSTLTISDLLSETNFPVWKHKAVSKFVKSSRKFNLKVVISIRSPWHQFYMHFELSIIGINVYNAVTTRFNNFVRRSAQYTTNFRLCYGVTICCVPVLMYWIYNIVRIARYGELTRHDFIHIFGLSSNVR